MTLLRELGASTVKCTLITVKLATFGMCQILDILFYSKDIEDHNFESYARRCDCFRDGVVAPDILVEHEHIIPDMFRDMAQTKSDLHL